MRQATTPLPDTREPGAGTPQTLSRRSGPEHRLAASIPEPRSAARAMGSSSAATRDADGQERHDGSPALSGSEIQAYRTALLRHIEKFRRYPNEARLAGQQGVVRVQFEMTRAGAVVGAFVESSSGISVLDTEATSAIARAAPLPAAPAGWPDTFGVRLPIAFFLQ